MRIKLLLPGLLIILVLTGAWLGYSRFSGRQNQKNLARHFPSLLLPDLTGQVTDLKSIASEVPSVLIYFNSGCTICQSEAELIRMEFATDSITHFFWVSSESPKEIRFFSELFGYDALNSHSFYSDSLFTLASAFQLTGVPATFVYDAKGDLIDYYIGVLGMSELKKSIRQAHDRSR